MEGSVSGPRSRIRGRAYAQCLALALLGLGLLLAPPARGGDAPRPPPGDLRLDMGPEFDRSLGQDLVRDAIEKSSDPAAFEDARTRLRQYAERAALAGDVGVLDAMLAAPVWDQPMVDLTPRDLPFEPTWEGAQPLRGDELPVDQTLVGFLRDWLQQVRDAMGQPGGYSLALVREGLQGLGDQLTGGQSLHPDARLAVALKRRFRLMELLRTLAHLNGLKPDTGESRGFLSDSPGQALAQLEDLNRRRRGTSPSASAAEQRDAYLQLPGVVTTEGDFWDRRWPLLRDLQQQAREIRDAQRAWRGAVLALDAKDDAMFEQMSYQNFQAYQQGGGRERTPEYQHLLRTQAQLLDVLFRNALLAQEITVENPRAVFSFLGGTLEKPLWEVLIERQADPAASQRAIDQAIERLEENVRQEIARIGDMWDAVDLLNELFSPLYAPDLRLLVQELSPILPDVSTYVMRARSAWFGINENLEIQGAVFQSLKTGFLVAGGIFFPVGGALVAVGVSGTEWYLSAAALEEARRRLGTGGAVQGSALIPYEDAVSASMAGFFIDSLLLPLDLAPLHLAIVDARAAAKARAAGGASDAARGLPAPGHDSIPGLSGLQPAQTPSTSDFLFRGRGAQGEPVFGLPDAPAPSGAGSTMVFDAQGRLVPATPGTAGAEPPRMMLDPRAQPSFGGPRQAAPGSARAPPSIPPGGSFDLQGALDQARKTNQAGALEGRSFEVLNVDPDGPGIPFRVGPYVAHGGTGQLLVAEAADGTAVGVTKFFRSRKATPGFTDEPGISAAYGQLGGYHLLRDTFGAERYMGPRVLGWDFSGDTPIMLLERFPGDPTLQRRLTQNGFQSLDDVPVGQSWPAATDRPWNGFEQEGSIRLDMELSENKINWEDGHADNRLHVRTPDGVVTVPGEQDRFFRAGSDFPRVADYKNYVQQRFKPSNLIATDASRFEAMLDDADGFRRIEWEGRGFVTPVRVGTTADGTLVNGFVSGRYDIERVARYDPAYYPIATDASGRTIYGLRNGHYRLDELSTWDEGITPLPPNTGFLLDDAPPPGFGPFGGLGRSGAGSFGAAGAGAFAVGPIVGGQWVDWKLGPETETLLVQGMAPIDLGSTSEGREFSSNFRLNGGGAGYVGLPAFTFPSAPSLPERLTLSPTLRLWGGSADMDIASDDPAMPDTNFDLKGDGTIFGAGFDLDVYSSDCPWVGRLSYGYTRGDFDLERSPCSPGTFLSCDSQMDSTLDRHAFGAQLGRHVSPFIFWGGVGYSHDDLESTLRVRRALPSTPTPLTVTNRIEQTLERRVVEGLAGVDARLGPVVGRLETRFDDSDVSVTFQVVVGLRLFD